MSEQRPEQGAVTGAESPQVPKRGSVRSPDWPERRPLGRRWRVGRGQTASLTADSEGLTLGDREASTLSGEGAGPCLVGHSGWGGLGRVKRWGVQGGDCWSRSLVGGAVSVEF